MTLRNRRLLLLATFLWAAGLLFLPIRNEIVTGYFSGNSPETQTFRAANEIHTCSIAIDFNGHPAGIKGLVFFALMPFFVVWQSFSIRRPYTLPVRALIQMQALLLFLGGPYCYYMITFTQGYFSNAAYTTEVAWGGWILFAQNILVAVFLFTALAMPGGKTARLFSPR